MLLLTQHLITVIIMNAMEKVTKYHISGAKYLEYTINKNGEKEGTVLSYFDNKENSKQSECEYKNDFLHGISKYWKEGKHNPYLIIEYNNGHVHGRYEITIENKGSEIREYKNDMIVRVISLKDSIGRECVLDEKGELEVWKACRSVNPEGKYVNVYVRLLVPPEAKRVTPISGDFKFKSRVSCGTVKEIVDEEGKEYVQAESSMHLINQIVYELGKKVESELFDPSYEKDCTFGIHVHRYKDQCKQWFQIFP
jgi:hypothetical protein